MIPESYTVFGCKRPLLLPNAIHPQQNLNQIMTQKVDSLMIHFKELLSELESASEERVSLQKLSIDLMDLTNVLNQAREAEVAILNN